jgi:hypothetical protein
MRGWITLLLAFLFLSLGSYVYFVELRNASSSSEDGAILSFEDQEALELILLRHSLDEDQKKTPERFPNETVFSRKEGDDDWLLQEPVKSRADNAEVASFLNALDGLKPSRTLTPDEDSSLDLETYGLGEPMAEVKIRFAKSEGIRLLIGDRAPIGEQRYIQVEGSNLIEGDSKEKVFLVEENNFNFLKKDLFNWRDKRIARFEVKDVEGLILDERAQKQVKVKRVPVESKLDPVWQITSPQEAFADEAKVKSVLSKLAFLNASSVPFESIDEAREAITWPVNPDLEATVILKNQENFQFRIRKVRGRRGEQILVTHEGSPAVYEIKGRDLDRISKGFEDLRQKRFLSHGIRDQVNRFQISFEQEAKESGLGKVFGFERAEGSWELSSREADEDSEKKDYKVKGDSVSLLLDDLNNAEAKSFPRFSKPPGELLFEIEVEELEDESVEDHSDEKLIYSIYLRKNKIYGRRGSSKEYLELEENLIDVLPGSGDKLLELDLPEQENSDKVSSENAGSEPENDSATAESY